MEQKLTITPPQWPPIGASASLLARFHRVSSPEVPSPSSPATTAMDTTEDSDCLHGDRPLRALSDSALRQEIARLERHLQETPPDSSDALRKSLQVHLDAAKHETRLREPEGHLLNKALSKQKLASTALQTAQDRFSQCQRDLQAAQESLAQARLNEEQATLEVAKLRASIAEQECPVQQPQLPSQVLIPLFAQLQQAGLSMAQLSSIASLLGAPPPPPPATVPGTAPPAQPPAPPAGPPGSSMVSQLLATGPSQHRGGSPPQSKRTGRSLPRRPMPAPPVRGRLCDHSCRLVPGSRLAHSRPTHCQGCQARPRSESGTLISSRRGSSVSNSTGPWVHCSGPGLPCPVGPRESCRGSPALPDLVGRVRAPGLSVPSSLALLSGVTHVPAHTPFPCVSMLLLYVISGNPELCLCRTSFSSQLCATCLCFSHCLSALPPGALWHVIHLPRHLQFLMHLHASVSTCHSVRALLLACLNSHLSHLCLHVAALSREVGSDCHLAPPLSAKALCLCSCPGLAQGPLPLLLQGPLLLLPLFLQGPLPSGIDRLLASRSPVIIGSIDQPPAGFTCAATSIERRTIDIDDTLSLISECRRSQELCPVQSLPEMAFKSYYSCLAPSRCTPQPSCGPKGMALDPEPLQPA